MKHRPSLLYVILAVLILTSSLLPLFINTYFPVQDYPLHYGRLYFLSQLGSDPFIQEHYEISFQFLPYLSLELISLPLMQLFSIHTTLTIVMALTMILIFSGTLVLHRLLFKDWYLWPLLSGYFLFNGIFIMGFIPYLLTLGLFLWALIGWILLFDHSYLIRIIYAFFAGFILYVCHLAAFAIYGISIFVYEIKNSFSLVNWRSIFSISSLMIVSALVPLILFFNARIQKDVLGTSGSENIQYFFGNKVYYFFYNFTSGYYYIDFISALIVLILLFLVFKKSTFEISRQFILVPITIFFIFLISPFYVNSAEFVDGRIPIIFPFLFFASTNMRFENIAKENLYFVILAATIIVRSFWINYEWSDFNREIKEIVENLSKLEKEGTIYTAMYKRPFVPSNVFNGLRHVAVYAGVVNTIFVPQFHTQRNQKILVNKEKYDEITRYKERDVRDQNQFDGFIKELREIQNKTVPDKPAYLLVIHDKPFEFKIDAHTTLLGENRYYTLLKI